MTNNLIKCPKCGTEISAYYSKCPRCGINLKEDDPISSNNPDTSTYVKVSGEGPIEALKFCAWLDLIASIIVSLVIFYESPTFYTIVLGVGILLQGIISCALFLVIASIAENLIAIRRAQKK